MYYPKFKILTNLYTNGQEFIIKGTQTFYKGPYWQLKSPQRFFTGETPQSKPLQELIVGSSLEYKSIKDPTIFPYPENNPISSIQILDYPNFKFDTKSYPIHYLNIPKEQDYTLGVYKRYFCKKTNEYLYLEISKFDYDRLIEKDSSIAYQLYIPFNLSWRLIGDKEQVYKTNKNAVDLIVRQNKFTFFEDYLRKDYTRYYKETV